MNIRRHVFGHDPSSQDHSWCALSRRDLLLAGGAALVAASATGCELLSREPTGQRKSSAAPGGKQAPALAKQVQAGALPPLAKRLPAEPLVIEVVDRLGRYGGRWQTVLLGPADTSWLARTVGYDPMVRWTPDFTEVVPNVAASVDVDDDGRTYTFHLREGLRWSDGELCTADDVLYVVEDQLLNTELNPVAPTWLAPNGEPPEVEAPDDLTVRFGFDQPHGLFLEHLATPRASLIAPRHHLEKFHKKYNKDVGTLVKQANAADWVEFYGSKTEAAENAELPTLNAWVYTTALGTGTRMVAKRNPYYWKTDREGRQLPYLDEVAFSIVNDAQLIVLKASNGELGMHCRHVNTVRNKPVIARGREAKGYDFFDLLPALMNEMMIGLNLAHEDKALREVFQNRDFRIGLSYAINRPDLIASVLQRQGEPWQGAPRKESPFYDAELAKQYTEFDVDKANEHLDRAGYTKRDANGTRLRPDGKPIQFSVEIPTPTLKDFWVDAMNLVKGYWAEVGVLISVNGEDRALFYERKEANKHDAGVWQGDGGLQDALLDLRWYMPFDHESIFATPWALWFTSGGKEGQEPPPAARRQMDLYRQVRQTTDKDEQGRLIKEILQIAKEEFWAIGTVLPTSGYGIVANNFHNVPESMPEAYLYPTPGPSMPEQYFIE
jgi:ABC-type transport system substrate-binding protein